jgi:hypothetical protein
MAAVPAGDAVRADPVLRTPVLWARTRRTHRRAPGPPGAATGHHGDDAFVPGGGGGGGGRPERRGWPMWAAIVVAVLLAAVLTLTGMVAQILANLAGSQLPGA